MSPLELVDPKRNPYLWGRFAPVHREIDAADLTVEGTLPVELTGAYVRNGPNPKFPPLGSYTYPMEVDFPAFNTLGFLDPHTPVAGAYTRAVLDPAASTLERTVLHDGISEFPRVDDRRLGRRHRYVTVGAASGRARTSGEHDVLCRVDLETGAWESFDTGAVIGEVVFAPRPGGTDELDGWYLTFGTSLDDGRSWLYVWDADTFPGPPRARVHIPQRVPNGLHGNWFAAG